jgi:probable rRNA maturation factor
VAIDVFVADEQSARKVDCERWARLAEGVLDAEGVHGDAEMSVLFVDEETIASLNERFMGEKGPTDVLSFPIDEEDAAAGRSPDNGGTGPGWEPPEEGTLPTMIGDVVVCPAVAFKNARQRAHSYEDEIALLVVHGILHLLGMDHEDDGEAEEMEAREQELLDAYYRPKAKKRQ